MENLQLGGVRNRTLVLGITGILIALLLAAAPTAGTESRWQTASLIETDDTGDAYTPQIAFDSAGNAIAVWQQYDGASELRYNIWAKRFVPGTGWGIPTLLETDNMVDASDPRIAVAPNGNGIAVWEQYDGISDGIWMNRYVPGSGWGTATWIETNDTGPASNPNVAINSAGNAIVVWQQYDGVTYNVRANTFIPGNGWGNATLLETDDTGEAGEAKIALEANGNGIGVWHQYNGTIGFRYNIWANRFVAGTGWGNATLLETDDTGDAFNPQIGVDANGNAVVVWEQYDGSWSSIRANRFVPGTGWGTPTWIETDDLGEANHPQIDVDPNGNGIAVWEQEDGFKRNIWANRFVAGTGWGNATIVDNGGGDAYGPRIAVDANGNGIVAWHQNDGSWYSIGSNRYMSGKGWGTASWIETDDMGDAYNPQIDLDPNGHAIAVWEQSDGLWNNIWANRFVRDVVPPSIVLTSPTGTLTRNTDVMVAGMTEPGAQLTVNDASVPVGADGTFSTTVALAEGPNPIAVVATDDEGNRGTVLRSVTRDTVPPSLTVSMPSEGARSRSSLVRVAGTVEVGATLSVRNLPILPDDAGGWQVDLGLPDGTHSIAVRAVDMAGNVATLSRTVTVDTVVPEIVLTSPMTQVTREVSIAVSGFVSDPSASVTVNGAPASVGAAGDFSMTLALVEGPNAIAVAAIDAAGNAASLTRSIRRDSIPPALAVSTPANGASLDVSVVRVSGTSEAGVDLTVNGLRVVVDSTGAWRVNLSLSAGENTIMAVATDAAGNTVTASVSVTYVDPVSGIEEEQGQARDNLVQVVSRLDSLGLQMIGILAVLIASLALNGYLFLRYRTLRQASPSPLALARPLEPPPPDESQTRFRP